MTELTRRRFLLASAAVITAGMMTGAMTACTPRSETPVPQPPPRFANNRRFVTGASCRGAADGVFGTWRSVPVGVASTWGRDGSLLMLEPGGEYGAWEGDLDYAAQYYLGSSFTWRSLADGEYDDRLRRDLNRLAEAWGARQGAFYYRFQHEFNGHWYPWSVTQDAAADHIAGWRHFAGLFRERFGDDDRFRLSWSPAIGTRQRNVQDIRALFPGTDVVDLIGVDFYDFFPAEIEAEWDAVFYATDDGGGPVGIGAWQAYAEEVGLPLALPEWGQQYGDNPLFIEKVHEFLEAHRFTGEGRVAGHVVYDCYFNQIVADGSVETSGDFLLSDNGVDYERRPEASARYRELWSSWIMG